MKISNYYCLLALAFALNSGFGQSAFVFLNYDSREGINAPVFDGNGNRLLGDNYVAMLYGGLTTDSLTPALSYSVGNPVMPAVPFTYTPNGLAGYFYYPGIVFFQNEATSWMQVRAWDTRLGASYEEVAKQNVGGYGESAFFQDRGGPIVNLPLPGFLLHLQSFSLLPEVPEARTTCLLIMGLVLIWIKLRFKAGQ
ncbi:MAG: hypothetical protein M1608_08630 [Candidatus Omnitrophica bacterium]|nr:hypothetical protein [Candidatus Omnitrophota bacterium]